LAARSLALVLADRDAKKSAAFVGELTRLYPGSVLDSFAVDLSNAPSRLTRLVVPGGFFAPLPTTL